MACSSIIGLGLKDIIPRAFDNAAETAWNQIVFKIFLNNFSLSTRLPTSVVCFAERSASQLSGLEARQTRVILRDVQLGCWRGLRKCLSNGRFLEQRQA